MSACEKCGAECVAVQCPDGLLGCEVLHFDCPRCNPQAVPYATTIQCPHCGMVLPRDPEVMGAHAAACHPPPVEDRPDLDAIEARAAAMSAYSHRDVPVLSAYARRLESQCKPLAELLAVLGRENTELRAEVARLERVIAARRFYDG